MLESKDLEENIESGTYEIIRKRLDSNKIELESRLTKLNDERQLVFGSLETILLATDRINTENNCIASDIISIGNHCILGYNVPLGLRTGIKLNDVFGVYRFADNSFHALDLGLINDPAFITDFTNIYKYYSKTFFKRFAIIGNYLHMVFQLSESTTDVKTFKWLIKDNKLSYLDNRSEDQYRYPQQHDFEWRQVDRDMHRQGLHPHISILDKVYVEAIGGDITIKKEDDTTTGKGIYSEQVTNLDQTLDDAEVRYADLGNLIALEIKPFQEHSRFFIYNHKLEEVNKIDSIQDACILLPDDQGIIFPTGYYLQTGKYHIFDNAIPKVKFSETILSPNGEDVLYVFYSPSEGLYNLMSYNIISQQIQTPIICSGFTILENGELCYFKKEEEQTKHHFIQIWQTPYIKGDYIPTEHQDNYLYKIGNKDIVKLMAESQALITLLNKEDNYSGLYSDINKIATNITDSYFWIADKKAFALAEPLKEIRQIAKSAINEYEKVVELKKRADQQTRETQKKAMELFRSVENASFDSINQYVDALNSLRKLQGEIITQKELRYIDTVLFEQIEKEIIEATEKLSERSVTFLLKDDALLPYVERIEENKNDLKTVKKAIEAKKIEEDVNKISLDLELLIEIVSNLKIEDTSQSTNIIDSISLIFAKINQLKAAIKNKIKSLGGHEAKAEFAAQMKLIDQSLINVIDLANTPDKADDFQAKIAIQLEELESKFAEYDDFVSVIMIKREEIYEAFNTRKNSLIEKQNQKIATLTTSANRILKNIDKKSETLKSTEEINGYFASDLMVTKVRDIIKRLNQLGENGNAEELSTALKISKEDALRKLKDKKDLYEDGENIIKLGSHKFGVNKQPLDLTIIHRDNQPLFHLTGTNYYHPIESGILKESKYWTQEYVSENSDVYRSEYLAYKVFSSKNQIELEKATQNDLENWIDIESSENYTEGYTKGVHDHDALAILKTLIQKHLDLKLLRYNSNIRAYTQFFWYHKEPDEVSEKNRKIKAAGDILALFPESHVFDFVLSSLTDEMQKYAEESKLYSPVYASQMASYLMQELQNDDEFQLSKTAKDLQSNFEKFLEEKNFQHAFAKAIDKAESFREKIELTRQYVQAYIKSCYDDTSYIYRYLDETVANILFHDLAYEPINSVSSRKTIHGMRGSHPIIINETYTFDYHNFIAKLSNFTEVEVPTFLKFKKEKSSLIEKEKGKLKLSTFRPNVLSSFVRNKLIDQVYLPLFGNNFAKQLGTIDSNQRTDRMGLLLLISPPGYGKTTLMEYLANRLGLVFMKINGPTIGHEVTSVDPMAAKNSAAREELKKLNLAFEMGNNVMLYLDDIQHCNPEFLQKFISLSDGSRTIDGVYNGKPKTYNLRGKKFAVVMAGNPYTESGDKFQVPDMLSNRADIYNLGDIIGDTKDLFELSLIENSLAANPSLRQLRSNSMEDVYKLIHSVQNNVEVDLEGKYATQELNDYKSVLEKILLVRDTVLNVNANYIKSAAMEDEYRKEPSFKLQGSYRDMNKLVDKIVPVMNNSELKTMLLTHYESEAQTLTTAAEANLLKYKELTDDLSPTEKERWEEIKTTFIKNNKLKGFGNQNEMAQLLAQLMNFSDNLEGIKEVLAKGLNDE